MGEPFELRAPRADEVEAVAAALNAHSRALYATDDVTPEEVRAWFENPSFDVERDIRIAVLADGAIAGYADVGDQADEHTRFWIDLRLHPERGDERIADALLAAMEDRARERAGPGAVLRGYVPARSACPREGTGGGGVGEPGGSPNERRGTPERRLFERHGYGVIRHSFRMEIELSEPPSPPEWPAGFSLRPFRRGEDDEAVYEANQDAFADHWGYMRDPYEEWRHWMFREPFDPELWLLAEADSELAGVCLCRSSEGGDEKLGWVAVLGVRPPWRRRGLGLALLRQSFVVFAARGNDRVGLGVDAENVSGAVRLYERAGMRVVRKAETWERAI